MRIRNCLCIVSMAALLLIAGAAAGEEFTVAQVSIEPSAVADTEALRFTKNLGAGWNLGNTFDAADCAWLSDKLDYETAWAGVKTTPRLFETLRDAGFSSVRIPVSWHNHVNEDFVIDDAWLARVREVVGYALDAGVFVIVNTHHDIAEAYLYPDPAHLENSMQYITAIWSQLSQAFIGTGERLIFEAMNEPRLKGTNLEWWLNPSDARSAEAVRCINALNQAFVDTVRASGGENARRYLMVPGYGASLDGATHKEFALPTDTVEDRIIVSVHAYTPYAFALQAAGEGGSTADFSPERQRDRTEIDKLMHSLYYRFIRVGVPVVMGEFGARDKNGNLQARADFYAYYVAAATARGIPCFVWDNNAFTGGGELFGLLERSTNSFAYPQIVQSIMRYAP